ncbi:MBL fold metallo-hydrolase [Candidatus Pacearchaeota archaeon]|nr:MBL fold metallo-hydrolase [Candidatus Pacearchaeota archaeon]
MFKVYTLGGYSEVGKNMTAVDFGEDIIVFDAGIYLPAVIDIQETNKNPTAKMIKDAGALPDDHLIYEQRDKVRAFLITHAHLDHVGAVQHIANQYPNAVICGTPFTIEVLKALLEDTKTHLKNKLIAINPNSSYMIRGKRTNYQADFVNITHSTIQSTFIALHSSDGIIVYANDYKLDNDPVMGEPPNYEKMKQLAKKGVKLLIVDSLYSGDDRKTHSEKIARAMVEEVMLTIDHKGKGLVITTFSSHIARLKSIVEFSKKLNRKVVFVGRSLSKYVTAAKKIRMCPFEKDIVLVGYSNQVKSKLKQINDARSEYVLVCTGHQGEPGSILDRIVSNELPFQFKPQDSVIFASKIIPVPVNMANRANMEKKLRQRDVRIFNDVHVSVLPDTQVVINDSNGIKLKEIGMIEEDEKKEIKVPAFDPNDLKIKWYNAKVVEHPYNGKIFNIKTKSGRSVSITSGHSLFKLEKDKIISKKGDLLKIGDYLAIPKRFSWYKELDAINALDYINIKNNNITIKEDILYYNKKHLLNINLKLNKDFARLLGYYLAEGSAPRHISFVINKKEDDLLKEIKTSIKECFPYSNIKVIDKGTSYEITFGARILGNLFKSMFGENARTKKIPKFVFSANEEFKLNFVGAYINGDGCIDKGSDHFRIRIKTASEKLASDLLYLFTQLGICAKFDHIQLNKKRFIAGNKKETNETYSYVIRIQNIDYLNALKNYLSDKFKIQIEEKSLKTKFSQQFPPEALPIEKLNFSEIVPKKGTYLWDIINYSDNSVRKKQNISKNLLVSQSESLFGFTSKIINGDLLFDPIKKITVSEYTGPVYDFSVPGAQNFIGGFGGLMLHNSGHGGREDLRDLVNLLKPENVIPSHGGFDKTTPAMELFKELGYKYGKTAHLCQNNSIVQIK